ncbi:MAG: tRNA lysidine(34) synthetase TilS, partial [Actinobacteria bacterium]|nr:tRNA lysidine(34) synthetase TilS [Actinomycetota bacterium]
PDVLKKRVIIAAIEKFKGNLENIKSANIDDALKTCFSGGERKELSFTDNIKFVKEADKIYLIYSSGSKDIASISIIKEYDMVKEYDMLPGKEQEFSRLGIRCISEIIDGGIDNIKKESISCSEAYVDFDKIIFPVKVRTWIKNGGEKFYPLGAFGSKKLHDFFIDKKVPLSFRNKVSLFLDCEKIIWIGKYIIDERVKVDLNTRRILHIKIFDI